MKLVPHDTHPGLFWVEWEDGVRSEMFYNKDRATDFIRRLEDYRVRFPNSSHEEGARSVTDEFK
jgi:hypothetical protein